MQFLKKFNGTRIEAHERRDFEIYYLKIAYETYLREEMTHIKEIKDRKVETLEDEDMAKYMLIHHPRFYDLAHIYGSPLDMVNLKKEGKNIA